MVETEALNPGLIAKAHPAQWGGSSWTSSSGSSPYGSTPPSVPGSVPGPGTALTAAFVIWLAAHAAYASYAFMGYYSWSLVGASSVGGLVAALAGGYVGARLYRAGRVISNPAIDRHLRRST